MNDSSVRHRAIVVAMVAFVVLGGFVGMVTAQPVQQASPAQTGASGTLVVEEGQTSNGISTVAGTVVIRGTVNGDVNVVSGDVVIEESGTVTGNVNGATGSLRIAGTVGGNVDVAAGSIVVDRSAQIGGNLNIGTGSVLIAGEIAGDVTVGADEIRVAPSAVIAGDLRYDGALTLQEGATVDGSVIRDDSIGGIGPMGMGANWHIPNWVNTIYGFFANLLLGVLLLALFPRFSNDVADSVGERTLRSGGWGLLLLFGIPVVLVAFAITIIGIPVALLGLMLYVLAIWIGVVYGEYAVGRYLLARFGGEGRWTALLLGLVLFALLGLLPVIGGIAVFLALLVGLGALGAGLWGRFSDRRSGGDEAEQSDESADVNDTTASDTQESDAAGGAGEDEPSSSS